MRLLTAILLLVAATCKYKTPDRSNILLESFLFGAPWMAVATGTNCTGWVSTDAKNWKRFQFPGCTTGTITGIVYGESKFVAVGTTNGSTCSVWTGTGIQTLEWTQRSCGPTNLGMTAIAFGSGSAGSEFVAGGITATGTTFAAISSPDGISWSDATITDSSTGGQVMSIVYWPTAQQFVESTDSVQSTRRRSIGGGTNWMIGSATGVNPPRLVAGPTAANGIMRIYNWGNSPSVVQYADDAYVSGETNLSPNIFSAGTPVANAAIHGEGKRTVFVRDSCGVTYLTSISGADTSGSYTMSNCTTANIKSIGYIEPYYIAGSDDGSFYYSVTGLPSDWARASSSSSSETTQKIAGRPGIL
ncbi:MAG: hypothetical protein K8S54_16695 [Spirochaetia bacterium]|nr:hypothetical protein [Spirochaetia bacterium]